MSSNKPNYSLWRESYSELLYPSLVGELHTDVVIIGAGITGLTSAYLLKKAGFSVAVLEKDTVGGGTTGRTTGKVTAQHGLIYNELKNTIGDHKTRLYADLAKASVDMVDKIVHAEKIACDWERDDNYVFTADPDQLQNFKTEAAVAEELGLPATFTTASGLPFEIKGAVKFSGQGKFNSQQYVLGLARAVHGEGSYVYEASKVTSIRDGNPCSVKTSNGKIIAKHTIVATNVPTLPLMARGTYCALEYPTESYIVAAEYDKPISGMYISPDSNHYSILPVQVGEKNMLLIGGGGHLSGLRGSKKWRFSKLQKYAEQQFGMTDISYKWSDRDYIAYDKIPLIGKLYPWSKNLYVATAFKKWGLSGGTMAAMMLAEVIANKDSKYLQVFSPQRSGPIKSIPKAVVEQIGQLKNP